MLDPEKLAVLRERIASLGDAQRALLRRQLEAQGIDWQQVDPDAVTAVSSNPFDPRGDARPDKLPLSASQAHVWVLHQVHPQLTAYHIPFAWSLLGELDRAALRRAVDDLIARHEALRTLFPQDEDGRPLQRVLDAVDADLQFEDLEDVGRPVPPSAADTEGVDDGLPAAVRARAMALAAQPFDLALGPLLRLRCVRVDVTHHVLIVVLHHLVADGWSRGVLLRELAAAYSAHRQGRDGASLPPLASQYADHVLVARRWRDSDDARRQLDYWRERLQDLAPLELPTDRPRTARATFDSRMRTEVLPHALNDALKGVARQHGVTQFMLLLGLFKLLLYRYTGQSDIAVGVPVSGRLSEQAAGLIGFFVNTLVMRTQFDDVAHARLADWLRRVKASVAGALEHQAVPFADVVEACNPQRSVGRNPLFEIMFQAQTDGYRTQNAALPDVDFDGLGLRQHAVTLDQTKFDMSWHLLDRDDGLLLAVEYRSGLFDAPRIARMMKHYRQLLQAVAAAPQARLADLALLDADERAAMLTMARGAALAGAGSPLLPQAFDAQVGRSPDAVAVCDDAGNALSYRALQRRADRLARHLRRAGLDAEQRVGVCLPRTTELLIALLGVMRAGGAFVPLDPTLPAARLQHMVQDSDCRVLLTAPDSDLHLPDGARCRIMTVAETDSEVGIAGVQLPVLSPAQLAYVIYTSGSSGAPKGTLLTHRGLAHYLEWCRRAYPVAGGSAVPVHSSIGFDATLTALFAPLLVGCTVHLLSHGDELSALAGTLDDAPSLIKLTPAHLQALPPLLDVAPKALPQAFIIGGEALTSQHLAFWRENHPRIALINEYGPTEAVVGCCVHEIDSDDSGDMPIGRPIDGVQLYVLDAYLQPQPCGVAGELYIAGPGVARGYLGQPRLTAERFVPNPFATDGDGDGDCLYRTGDLACFRDDGVLLYLGRRDAQLQLHGYRIEPGEIEQRLVRHPAVSAAAVAVRAPAGNPQLAAFVCTGLDEAGLADSLRDCLAEDLPDYMLPVHYRIVDEMPLTANGKLDRNALPDISLSAPAGAGRDPENDTEAALLAVWREALDQSDVGVEDNFFARGGDSITGMQIVALARKAGLRLTPAQLFQHQTVAAQARVATPLADDGERFRAIPDGAFALAPVQWHTLQRLDGATGANVAQHNQGVLLRVGKTLQAQRVEQALKQLLLQHDALRLVFERKPQGGGWVQQYAAAGQCTITLETLELSTDTAFDVALNTAIARFQQGFNLARPPLLRAVLMRAPDGEDDRLLLLAHHLIVDALSWRVLLADLRLLYRQAADADAAGLPDRSSSYAAWIAHLDEQTTRFEASLAHWRQACRPTAALPRDGEAPQADNLIDGADWLQVALDAGATARLLDSDRGQGVDAALLTSLVQTLGQWARLDTVVVDVEGHGRHAWHEGLDLSRTVGWFTCIYPLRVTLPHGGPAQQLTAVQEVLAATPDHGLSYGVLRMRGHEDLCSPAEVSLNYLGRSDDVALRDDQLLGLDTRVLPAFDAAGNPRAHLIDVVAWIEGDSLQLLWRFHRDLHLRETVLQLAERQRAALQSLTLRPDADRVTPTAVTGTRSGVDQASLKKLVARVGARKA